MTVALTIFLACCLMAAMVIAGLTLDAELNGSVGNVPWHISAFLVLRVAAPFALCAFLIAAMLVSSGIVEIGR